MLLFWALFYPPPQAAGKGRGAISTAISRLYRARLGLLAAPGARRTGQTRRSDEGNALKAIAIASWPPGPAWQALSSTPAKICPQTVLAGDETSRGSDAS